MIRFRPDTWLDALMRPFDMVAPEAAVYVEFAAPDARLAAAVLLGLAALLCGHRLQGRPQAALALLGLTLLAMAPWLVSSGNGRYFIAFLVLSGPLAIGLLRLLPLSVPFRLTLGLLLVLVQLGLLHDRAPWHAWGWIAWEQAPYFSLAEPPADAPVRYVTLAGISYSLVAPQFPARSGWINLSRQFETPRDREVARRFLDQAGTLRLLVPSIPEASLPDGAPSAAARRALDDLLRGHGLRIAGDAGCTLLRSRSMALLVTRGADPDAAGRSPGIGFWICPLARDPAGGAAPAASPDPRAEAVFGALERRCPRFFRPGEGHGLRVEGGHVRQYLGSDTKAYVLDDGTVMYKFWRDINAVRIGHADDILQGRLALDCDRIRTPNWRQGGP